MAKNIINELGMISGGGSGGGAAASTDWYSPTNGSRANLLTASPSIITLAERHDGIGLPFMFLNGITPDTVEAVAASPFMVGNPPCNYHTWSGQRDKDYYTVFCDDSYENSAIMIRFLKPCWVVMQGTICTGKTDTPATTSIGTGLLRWNGSAAVTFGTRPLGGLSITNEQNADGAAVPFNVMHWFAAGEVWKPILMSTVVTSILRADDGTSQGLMACFTYIEITRFSND